MTQEEKELLIKDLFGRLSYGVMVRTSVSTKPLTCEILSSIIDGKNNFIILPYLRPVSSMTEKEKEEERKLWDIVTTTRNDLHYLYTDFLLYRHIDYRGLIPMGLALEAPKDMYVIKN